MKWPEQQIGLFGSPIADSDSETQAKLKEKRQYYLKKQNAQEDALQRSIEEAEQYRQEIIEPARREYGRQLGLTEEEMENLLQDPLKSKKVLEEAFRQGITYGEASEVVVMRLVERLSSLDETVELLHKSKQSRFGELSLPKKDRSKVRRAMSEPRRRSGKSKGELHESPVWKEALKRYRELKDSGGHYDYEILQQRRKASLEDIDQALNVDQERRWDQKPDLPDESREPILDSQGVPL